MASHRHVGISHYLLDYQTLSGLKELVKRFAKRNASKSKMNNEKEDSNDKKPTIKFQVKEKVDIVYKEVLSLVITIKIVNCIVPRLLIKRGSSHDIMYVGLFEELGLDKGRLPRYKGIYLHLFIDFVTHIYGSVE